MRRADYRYEITYTAVVEPELVEWTHGPSPVFDVTVNFGEEGSHKTSLSMQMLFPTKEERDRTVEMFGVIEGQKQTLGRLKEYLAAMK